MEFFFIVILAIGLFVLWLRSQDTTSSLRDDIARLEREIGFLQSQLSSLVKAQAASASPHPAQESPAKEIKAAPQPVPQPAPPRPEPQQPAPPTPTAAQHAPPKVLPRDTSKLACGSRWAATALDPSVKPEP